MGLVTRDAYPHGRFAGGGRAPRMERKVLGSAGCSSHASPFRIPRRSRFDLAERFLLALGADPAHCACPVRRAAPPLGSRGRVSAPGFTWSRAGGDRRSLGQGLAGRWVTVLAFTELPRPGRQSYVGQLGPESGSTPARR